MLNHFKKIPSTIIHILIWFIFLGTSASQIYLKIGILPQDFILRTFILIVAFYLNYSILVPHLLLNKKTALYFFTLIAFGLFFMFVMRETIPRPEFPFRDTPDFHESENNFIPKKPSFFLLNFGGFFSSGGLLLLIFALSTSVKLGIEWFKSEKQRVIIESQKVNSELSFLKAQLNPHFLFNSLNSIYSLAHKQSKDTTNAIVMLSELMRYMIYEANQELVSLKNETQYIKNYMALQLLRLKDSSHVKFNIHGPLNYKIEPMLLISFIENAFKYGTDFKGNTQITIKITIKDEHLHLYVYNAVSHQKSKTKDSGVGLENIKNRLKLLYPNQHTLVINDHKDTYEVNLRLKLKSL